MRTITTIGLDIAKSVFQVHGIDAVGNVMNLVTEAADVISVLRPILGQPIRAAGRRTRTDRPAALRARCRRTRPPDYAAWPGAGRN